jgi:hypothetical protein
MIVLKIIRTSWPLALLLLSSCNTLYLGYNNLNWLTRWKLDSYFDLTSEQDEWLNVQLAKHISWHSRKELPLYADFLREIQLKSQDGVTVEEWREVVEQVELGWNRLADRLRPDAAKFLADLDSEQVEELRSVVENENEELEERLKESMEEREAKRRERREENLEEWFGELSPEQLRAFERSWLEIRPKLNVTKSRLERQKESQRKFFNLLDQKLNAEQTERWLIQWQSHLQDNDLQNDWRSQYESRALAIDQILTDDQRKHALLKLEAYALELDKLISEN